MDKNNTLGIVFCLLFCLFIFALSKFAVFLTRRTHAQELYPGGYIYIQKIELPAPPPKEPLVRPTNWGGQCVEYIQNLGYTHQDFRGYAGDIKPNTPLPAVGRAILIDYGNIAHTGLITAFTGNVVYFKDSNFRGDEQIGKRSISVFDVRIRGYFDFDLSTESSE